MNERGVLFVGNFLSSRGSNPTYAEDLSCRLEARSWRVMRTSSRRSRIARLGDMVATTWRTRSDYDLALVDVFSGAAFLFAETVCFELRRLRKPYVLTLRGGNLPAFSRRWPRRVSSLLRSATAVTAPSAYLQRELAGVASTAIVIPNALDLTTYPFVARRHVKPRLVWVRAFHEVYNPVMAVEVLARLADRDATLTMIGTDKGDGSLETVQKRARELDVASRLCIVPGVPKRDVAGQLAPHGIFLNTTNVDNAPISVLEAMASGLCVVSTNVGGIPDLLEHERDALLTPPRDVTAMELAIRRVLDDPDLAARMSSAARAKAAARDWPCVLDQWESLFARVGAPHA